MSNYETVTCAMCGDTYHNVNFIETRPKGYCSAFCWGKSVDGKIIEALQKELAIMQLENKALKIKHKTPDLFDT